MKDTEQELHIAQGRIVDISRRKRGNSTYAHVEFTDYEGQPAKGEFLVTTTPLYTKLRVGTQVELSYAKDSNGWIYKESLLHPEKYRRTPTEEELSPYERNDKLMKRHSIMGIFAMLLTIFIYRFTGQPLVLVALVFGTYLILKNGSSQKAADKGKFLSWYDKEEPECPSAEDSAQVPSAEDPE